MIQNPRYIPVLLLGAIVLLLLTTLHMSGGEAPEVLAPIDQWSNPSRYDGQEETQPDFQHDEPPGSEHDMPPDVQNTQQGVQYDTQHDAQHDEPHGSTPAAAPAFDKPIPDDKNHDKRPTFTEMALKYNSDKVTTHNYGFLYEKYLAQFRDESVKMIELGLGCGMPNGTGASYLIWTTYFPKLQINIVEYDEPCGSAWAAKNPEAVIFYGNQSSVPFLHHVGVEVTSDTRLVDIIVDEGGHTMDQQTASLRELWSYLRPGGVYFAENLQTSFVDDDGGDSTRTSLGKKTFIRWIHELVDDMTSSPQGIPAKNAWSSEIASIDCMAEMCVLTKKDKNAR
ncbi:hypothetical protein LZ32DRAFT_660632 [Colletotrichum eremochloae]|nr:hypothetical protein LZ32DRAFT_660632 [Colletotrichum eremochloae]